MSQPSLIADLLDRLDAERRYEFDERAGSVEVSRVTLTGTPTRSSR
jgi:hypothetical protein